MRIKFAKTGLMKFIGHLDLMRFFQKSMRRAGIDIAFSEGLSPHMIMSFASPLGVGITSSGEYMDIEVRTPLPSGEMVRRLNAVMAEGLEILDCRQIEEGRAANAMSLVAAADYRLTFPAGNAPAREAFSRWMSQSAILVTKKTKKGEKQIDLRPLIFAWRMDSDGLFLRLSAGSESNCKCELVMDAFEEYAKASYPDGSYRIHRTDLYARNAEGGLVSLNDLGRPV